MAHRGKKYTEARNKVDRTKQFPLEDGVKLLLDTSYALHGLLPLLYRHLMAACADLVPDAALEELRKRHHENAA